MVPLGPVESAEVELNEKKIYSLEPQPNSRMGLREWSNEVVFYNIAVASVKVEICPFNAMLSLFSVRHYSYSS